MRRRFRMLIDSALPLWPFLTLWLLFLWPLLAMRSSFLYGDYLAQHLPWAHEAFLAVREGRWPFWTPLMGGGFPLFAEGQLAALYLPHLVAYRFLPFLMVYTWSIPAHLLIAGVGLYVYSRRLGMSPPAAGIAAACFGFGSAYGGCFYNTGSLRTLCWLPWMLWLFERVRADASPRQRMSALLGASLLAALQWTAGFSQLAVYAFGYAFFHEVLASGAWRKPWVIREWKAAGLCVAVVVWGTALALPQVLPSMELIGRSVRQSEGAAFALWGSMPPAGLAALVFPEWGILLQMSFYIGVSAVLWIILLFATRPMPEAARRHLGLALLFVLLAAGRHNPLYAAAVETFHLTMLRNPSKFLFFAAMSLSVAAGFGLDRCLAVSRQEVLRGLKIAAASFAAAAALLPGIGQVLLRLTEPWWARYSDWYVAGVLRDKGDGAKSAAEYLGRMETFFEALQPLFSYSNPNNWRVILAALLTAFLVWLWSRRVFSDKRFMAFSALLLTADLWVFGIMFGTGFVGNARPMAQLAPGPELSALAVQVAKDPGSLGELTGSPERELLSPNAGMYHGLAHIGGYSPLLLLEYHELVHSLGVSDGSLGRPPMDAGLWKRRRRLLDLIGLKYLRSETPLDWPGMTLLEETKGSRLYRNERAAPELLGVYSWKVVADRAERILAVQESEGDPSRTAILSSDETGVRVSMPVSKPGAIGRRLSGGVYALSMKKSGIGVTRISAYPGWRVWVDGRPVKWFTVNHAFIGFVLKEGEHEVQLKYEPTRWRLWTGIASAAAAVWLSGLVWIIIKNRRGSRGA
jgi:hypothetical protein